jgi:hypothetical protein
VSRHPPVDVIVAGAIIDGTGLTSVVPLTIKNGQNLSGVVVQQTGSAPSGYLLNNASGVNKGAVGLAVASNDWNFGSAADDIVITGTSRVFIRGSTNAGGVRLQSNLDNGIIDCNDSVGVYMQYTSSNFVKLDGTDTTNRGHFRMSLGRHQEAKGADVASASTLTLGTDGNNFDITGTTTINYITTANWQNGSVLRLRFQGSLTVTHNAGSVPGGTKALDLQGAANFSATAGAVLTLLYDSALGKFVEVGRRTA